MKLFVVKDTGSYALEVSVHRSSDKETLERTLEALEYPFVHRIITELSVDGAEGECLFVTSYIE